MLDTTKRADGASRIDFSRWQMPEPEPDDQPDDGDFDEMERPVTATLFTDKSAAKLRTARITLPQMRDLVLKTKAATKDDLPLLKLATFSGQKTDKGSLRSDDTVLAISGVEMDFDGENISFAEARTALEAIGVLSLLYTSPSHTEAKPRWRVVLPTSTELPPEMRHRLAARINGKFSGVFAYESFTLSQAYYYGRALDNPAPAPRAEVIDGRCIDLIDALVHYESVGAPRQREKAAKGFAEHLKTMGDGPGLEGFNHPLIRAASAYAVQHGTELDRAVLKGLLRDAIDTAPNKAGREDDIERYKSDKYLDGIIASAIEKFAFVMVKGRPANTQGNIRKALERLGVRLRYNSFDQRIIVEGLTGFDHLDDAAMNRLWLTIEKQFGFRATKDYFQTVIEDEARRNSFHPVRQYLDALKWDGVKRIDRWLVTYGGAEDTKYVRAVGGITLTAAVRRVRQPGCKFDEMLVLLNDQGKDKSSSIAALAVKPEWFSDDLPLGADSKKAIEQMSGRWIIEAAELNGMRKGDVEHLKSFLSRTIDRARLAYGRLVTELPRQSIVIGTTNAKEFLRDLTGNRRFWPVAVKGFNAEDLKRDRDQLWAEAAAREAKGDSIRLPKELWADAAKEQEARTVEEPWIELVNGLLGEMQGKLLCADAWTLVGVAPGARTQQHNERLGFVMRACGFERKQLRFGALGVQYCYVRHAKAGVETTLRIRVRLDDDRQPHVWIAPPKKPGEGNDDEVPPF